MAKLTLQLMKERTMDALAAHTDPKTVAAIGAVIGYGNLAGLLRIHRQVPDEVIHRWIFRDALKKMSIATLKLRYLPRGSAALTQSLSP